MADFDNTNRGVLFVNDRKQEGDRKPDRSGSINIEGVEYFIDGWLKKSAAGKPFMSLSVKRKDSQPQQGYAPSPRQAPPPQQRQAPQQGQAPQGRQGNGFDDMDSDIPF